MEAAFSRSDALVVEVDVGAVDSVALQRFSLEQGLLPPDQRLSERLDPETARLLGPAAQRVGCRWRAWSGCWPACPSRCGTRCCAIS